MSGGFFNYKQYGILDIAEELEDVINEHQYPDAVIDKFKEGLEHIKFAAIYTHRIDCLLSGDDDEDSFFERLQEDIDKRNA